MVFERRSYHQSSGPIRAPPLPITSDDNQRNHEHYHSASSRLLTLPTASQDKIISNKSNLISGTQAKNNESLTPKLCTQANLIHPYDNSFLHRQQQIPSCPRLSSSTLPAEFAKNGQVFKRRLKPLTIKEYEANFKKHSSDLQLVERVFHGGIFGNQLRAALWPLIFGLVKEHGRFIRNTPSLANIGGHSSSTGSSGYLCGLTNGQHHGKANNGDLQRFATNGSGRPTMSSSLPAFLSTEASRIKVSADVVASSNMKTDNKYVYIEHEDNLRRWRDLERQYRSYESQWKSIQPEQELRFSVFRERKALIERDVIRSDRSHPFYADNSANLKSLTTVLMTYMMYDFDIGYLQGMSDIAAPILYVFQGDLVKSFWVFVEVMKLFRRNFEYSQKTIHFQLNCLYRLVKVTDAKLARHLRDNECSNCFFVFRCIVCLFKRELMKNSIPTSATTHDVENKGGLSDGLTSSTVSSPALSSASSPTSSLSDDDDDNDGAEAELDDGPVHDCVRQVESNYNRVLNLWDTIWCVQRRHELLAKSKCIHTFTIANGKTTRTSQRKLTVPINISNGQQQSHRNTPSPLSTHSFNGFHSATNGSTVNSNNNNEVCYNHNNSNDSQQSHNCTAQRTSQTITRSCSYQNSMCCSPQSNMNANKQLHHHHHKQQQKFISHQTNGHSNGTGALPSVALSSSPQRQRHLNGGGSGNHLRYLNCQRSENSARAGLLVKRRQSNGLLCSNGSLANGCGGGHESHFPAGSLYSCCCGESPGRKSESLATAPIKQEQVVYTKETFYSSFDPNQADVPRFELTETEKFVLSLCMSLIRRERNQILSNQMDASEIHQHFINPRLADAFDAFVEQAYEVYEYLNTDCDLKLVVKGASELAGETAASSDLSLPLCQEEHLPDTYELLKDYFIISPTAYNISMTSLNNLNQKGSLSSGMSPPIRKESGSRYSVSQKSWDHFLNSEMLQ